MIAIICAIPQEFNNFKSVIRNQNELMEWERNIVIGKIGKTDVVLIKSGVGKVNAAISTCLAIKKYDVDFLINAGVSGALDTELNIGDVVFATETCYSELLWGNVISDNTNFISQQYFKRYKTDNEMSSLAIEYLKCSVPRLPDKIAQKRDCLYPLILQGGVVTSDTPVLSEEHACSLKKRYGGICVDMESSSIAHVCNDANKKILIIRTISDFTNGQSYIYLLRYANLLCQYLGNVIGDIVQNVYSF